MGDATGSVMKGRKASGRLVSAIIGSGLLIGLGLALGLGLGLRSRDGERQEIPPVTTQPPSTSKFQKAKAGTYSFAAVASDVKICSDIGRNILAVHQGSAVDAAIATSLCIGVVNMHNSGIGGGFFMTIYNRTTGTAYALDARERAPLVTNETFYIGKPSDASKFGGMAVAVPGFIKGHWEAHRKFGRVPWKDLLQPTITLCTEGVPVLPNIHRAIVKKKDILKNMSHMMYFNSETGEIVKLGDTIKYPALAQTLEVISVEGAQAYYNGSLTDAIVQDIQEYGGVITRQDLTEYTATWRTPLNLTLRDLTVYSMPPPGSGAVLEYILNIMDGYALSTDSLSTTPKSVLTYHRIVEAMKFAYAKRSSLGDPDFVDVSELIANMTSSDFAQSTRAMITDDKTHDANYYGATFYNQEDAGTSQISIVDAQGNAVGITATINTWFGSKVRGSKTGIVFNNEMDDFSTPGTVNFFGVPASEANFIQPRKRPLSSMCPTVVVNSASGKVELVIGAAGGTRITTATSLVAMYTLQMGLPLSAAIDRRRVHHQLVPETIEVEQEFPQEIIDGLKSKGHKIKMIDRNANVNAIHISGDSIAAVSDSLQHGAPSGY